MAHGVEIRAPFLDWRLATYSFSLPSTTKLGNGFTKLILREAMKGVLPEVIRSRRSIMGFASPMPEWYKGSLKYFILDTINSRDFLESDIWKGSSIRDYTEECYNNSDYINASKSWKYIQAMILMQRFNRINT